jgi:hypothetical protein
MHGATIKIHIIGVYEHRVQSMNFESGMPWGL